MRKCAISKMSIATICSFALCSLILAAPLASANDRDNDRNRHCSNRTLSGDYGTEVKGLLLPAPGVSLEFRGLSITHFNGSGGLVALEHIVVGGSPAAPGWVQSSGNYTVNPDCTGSMTVNTPLSPVPLNLRFVVVDNGKEIFAVLDAHALLSVFTKVGSSDHDD